MGHFKHFFWLIIGLTILGKAYASNTALISANKVYTQSSAPSMVIIDLRSAEKYEQGHIPNAINLPLNQFHRKKGQIDGFVQTPQSFRRLMEQAGIQNRDQLILYSDWSFLDAARAYWVLDFYGHQQKQILDGGFQAWQDQALPISLTASTKPTSSYMVSVMPDKLATKLQTLVATKNDNYLIIDARPPKQFAGEVSLTKRKGHIPESINIPWYQLLQQRNETDGYDRTKHPTTLNTIDTLKKQLGDLPKDKKLILYCNGGQESSILYVALKEMDRQAALYDGSWFEWSEDTSLPVAP